jgi:Zn-dependent protease with chaperone function
MDNYRYPSEIPILLVTVTVVAAVVLFSAGFTICLLPAFLGLVVFMAYLSNKAHTQALVEHATPVTPGNAPQLAALVQDCMARLRPGQSRVFVSPERQLNAYTFGTNQPFTVVLFAPLLKVMDADELRFIIGHELGHVALGHTWLNSLLGGMAGVPTTLGLAVILTAAFRWWNRACEYSADRAGLIACRNPEKAVSALVKLAAGGARSASDMQRALAQIEAEDDTWANVAAESFSTHPMVVRRIEELRKFAASSEYRRMAA